MKTDLPGDRATATASAAEPRDAEAGGIPSDEAGRPHPTGSALKRGTLWVFAGHAGSQVIRLGGNLALWRLLDPTSFGIMAIVNALNQGIHMFSDIGIGPSIVQNKRGDDPTYLNTAFTIQAIRGMLVFIAALLLAYPFAVLYREPLLAYLLPAVGLSSVISGFNSTNYHTATRRISLGRVTLMELVTQSFGLLVMIGGAALYRSVWALVIGALASTALKLVLTHTSLPGIRNRLMWDRPSAHTLLKFGRWIFVSTLLTFAVGQSDRLIFGRLIPLSVLGVYSIATVWASMPTSVLDRIFASVMFPLLSRLHGEGRDLTAAYHKARTPALVGTAWISACLLAGGPALTRFLYDQRATDAGWIIQILMCGTWFATLETANGTALLACGEARLVAIASSVKLVGLAAFIPLGLALGGFPGAVVGFAASELGRYVASAVFLRKVHLYEHWQDLFLSAMLAASALVGMGVSRLVRGPLGSLAVDHGRVAAFVEGAAILVVVSAIWGWIYLQYRARGQRLNAA